MRSRGFRRVRLYKNKRRLISEREVIMNEQTVKYLVETIGSHFSEMVKAEVMYAWLSLGAWAVWVVLLCLVGKYLRSKMDTMEDLFHPVAIYIGVTLISLVVFIFYIPDYFVSLTHPEAQAIYRILQHK